MVLEITSVLRRMYHCGVIHLYSMYIYFIVKLIEKNHLSEKIVLIIVYCTYNSLFER